MKGVAENGLLDDAVADLSSDAQAFLLRVHCGDEPDVRSGAAMHQRRLREFVRATGVWLEDLPSWRANITGWRAIARLANPVVATKAG
jgi:hypothetical protein